MKRRNNPAACRKYFPQKESLTIWIFGDMIGRTIGRHGKSCSISTSAACFIEYRNLNRARNRDRSDHDHDQEHDYDQEGETMKEMKKIGILTGMEWSWPPAFIEEIAKRDEGVIAEFVQLGGTSMNEPCPYRVIVDRISHEVPYYRSYLKNAVLQGTAVINDPFMWT